MSLARWIILVALLSSIGLGYYGYRLHSQRMELEDALANDVPKLSLELQNLAKRYTVLNKQFERDGLQGQSDPATYIRTIAAGRDVQIGDITVDPPQETQPMTGVLDTRYTIKPSNRDRGFPRLNIANFLFKLESESRRMRVTKLRMEPEAKSVQPENVLESDSWRWEAEVTTRTKM
jgi:hypothetical protein